MSDPVELSETKQRGPMGVLFLIVLMDLLGFGIIIPALPFYAERYQASALQVGLLFSLYSLFQLAATPVLGVLSDRYGRRPVLIFSQLGSVVGYALLGIVTEFNHLNMGFALGLIYLARIIDGASAGNISTAQAYIGDVTTPATRGKAMGMLGAAFGMGFTLGPAVGGLLSPLHHSFPAYAAALASLVAAVLTFAKLPESRVHNRDVASESILHPSNFAFVFESSVLTQLMFIAFATMGAFAMMESTFAIYLQYKFHFESLGVGLLFALAGLVIIVVQGGLIGRLTKRFGEWPLAVIGPVMVTCGMGLYVWTSWKPVVVLLLVAGLFNAGGRSLQGPALSSLVSKYAGKEKQGAAFGLYHALMGLSRVVGPLVAGLVYTKHPTAAFGVAGVVTFLCAGLTLLARKAAAMAEGPGFPVIEIGKSAGPESSGA